MADYGNKSAAKAWWGGDPPWLPHHLPVWRAGECPQILAVTYSEAAVTYFSSGRLT
jgi:hypothetical protein